MSSIAVGLLFLHCWTPMTADEFEICQSGSCQIVSAGIKSDSGQQCQVSRFSSPTIRACVKHQCNEVVEASTIECGNLSTRLAADGTFIASCS